MGWNSEGRWRAEDPRPHSHGPDSDRERFSDHQLFDSGRTAHGYAARFGHAEAPSGMWNDGIFFVENDFIHANIYGIHICQCFFRLPDNSDFFFFPMFFFLYLSKILK